MQLDHIEEAAQAAESAAEQALTIAQGFVVRTDAEYSTAGMHLKSIKDKARELDAQEKAITKPINESLKRVRDLFRRPKEYLASAESAIKRSMISYQNEVEAKRREEQRKAEEAARKERERLERQRIAAEQKAREKEAELRRRAAEADAAEREKIEAKIQADAEKAAAKQEALVMQAATVTAPVIHREPPRVAAISTREIWKAEVTDLMALVQAVAAGKAPIALLDANTAEIGKRARALKSEFTAPGIRVWSEKVMAA